jgi:hypothetical protein
LPFTPAELFRNALRAVREDLARRHTSFDKLPGTEQDAYLAALQTGRQDLHGVPSNVFFESLLALSIEGFFSDPVYGGNKDMAAWKMIGFPGAYASFYHLVDQHGLAYTRAPMSMGESATGVIRGRAARARPTLAHRCPRSPTSSTTATSPRSPPATRPSRRRRPPGGSTWRPARLRVRQLPRAPVVLGRRRAPLPHPHRKAWAASKALRSRAAARARAAAAVPRAPTRGSSSRSSSSRQSPQKSIEAGLSPTMSPT